MLKTIQWGIIGCGDVTELKSGPAFNKIQGSQLTAVMRRDTEKARDYALRHNVPKWYDNANDLMNDPDVNAIYIATPPLYHTEYSIRAMDIGKPVYVEKPMAASYNDCLKMIKKSEETKVPLFVAYYRRSLPYFKKVKEIIESGTIGKVLSASIAYITTPRKEDFAKDNLPWRVNKEIAGGGYFYDMASHQFDLLDFFFGPVTEVYGTFANKKGLYEAEDNVIASFKLENGITGAGVWNFVAEKGNETDGIIIIGEKGTLSFAAFDFTPIILFEGGNVTEYKPENPENIQYFLIKDVVEELQGIGKSPSDGVSGARTNKVMDIILQKI